jgi:hypothetical protein
MTNHYSINEEYEKGYSDGKKEIINLIEDTIIEMTGKDSLTEAVKFHDKDRKKSNMSRSEDLFEEMSRGQVAVLIKVLIDIGKIKYKDDKLIINK